MTAVSPYSLKQMRISQAAGAGTKYDMTDPTLYPKMNIGVYRLHITVSAATNLSILDRGNSDAILETFQLGANGGVILEVTEHAHYTSSNGGSIGFSSSAAVQVEGRVYFEPRQVTS